MQFVGVFPHGHSFSGVPSGLCAGGADPGGLHHRSRDAGPALSVHRQQRGHCVLHTAILLANVLTHGEAHLLCFSCFSFFCICNIILVSPKKVQFIVKRFCRRFIHFLSSSFFFPKIKSYFDLMSVFRLF